MPEPLLVQKPKCLKSSDDGQGSEGGLAGQRLGLELVVPVHRDLNGPQLETDWTISARIALTF